MTPYALDGGLPETKLEATVFREDIRAHARKVEKDVAPRLTIGLYSPEGACRDGGRSRLPTVLT
jgi:hypothetical protein